MAPNRTQGLGLLHPLMIGFERFSFFSVSVAQNFLVAYERIYGTTLIRHNCPASTYTTLQNPLQTFSPSSNSADTFLQ